MVSFFVRVFEWKEGGRIMYQRGDYVVKVPEGVCKIEEIGQFDISGTDREYYLLVPIAEQSSRIYVPTDNAAGRIRSVIKKAEAMQLIKSIPGINEKEISSEKMREQEYKEAILSGDPERIVSIIKLLYSRRQERLEQGKKATATDDRYFKQAEAVLFAELSFALDIPKENMEEFIAQTIEQRENAGCPEVCKVVLKN